jgi:hypothetical protein
MLCFISSATSLQALLQHVTSYLCDCTTDRTVRWMKSFCTSQSSLSTFHSAYSDLYTDISNICLVFSIYSHSLYMRETPTSFSYQKRCVPLQIKKKLKGRDNSEDLGINGSILLKLTQNKEGMRMCNGFTWILTGSNSEVSWTQEWIFWVHKR